MARDTDGKNGDQKTSQQNDNSSVLSVPVVGGTPSNVAGTANDPQKSSFAVKRSMTNRNDGKEDQKSAGAGKVTKDTSEKEEEKLGAPTSVGGAGSQSQLPKG